jgi:hypothetical protein
MSTLPAGFAQLILPFACLFSKRVFQSVQVLLAGSILATGKRTVTSALRIMGLSQERHFQNYHRVLNRSAWSSLAASQILLQLLVRAFAPEGPLVFGLDDTIERRWGAHCRARHLPRPGALVAQPFREGQRAALAVHDAAGAYPVGRASVGSSIPDHAVPVQTLL